MGQKTYIDEFRSPDAKWRGKPFWSWNGELRPSELRRQVNIMKEMGLGGYFMHSRSGLITEYLGKDWFDCIRETMDEGDSLGMENWLYDEDRWPSGSAGGKVTVEEQYRARSLRIHQIPFAKYQPSEEDILIFLADLDGLTLHSYQKWEENFTPPSPVGEWYVLAFRIKLDEPGTVFNGTTYIDTMSKDAVDRFIALTHEKYAEELGSRWESVQGIFTDEPHRGHGMDNKSEKDGIITCDICYTDDFFEEFEKRYHYDARECLPELFYFPQGKHVAPLKLHYFDLACNLFVERFAKNIGDWCRKHNIAFTGHVLHEDQLDCQTVSNGSLMRFYPQMDIPGIDVLAEQTFTPWTVKQLASVCRQNGKKMMLSELYGCTGWQMNLRSHKMVGDWQALLGINLRCHHLSWYTMEGESKRDYPASILHQSAWYRDYRCVEDYFARFSSVISAGSPLCDLLVLNPIESVWCQTYLGWANWLFSSDSEVNRLNQIYQSLSLALLGNHIDYDYGEEQLMQDARIETDENGNAILCVGEMRYHTVLVAGMVTMRPSTLTLLTDFAKRGGKIVFAGDPPAYVDALPSSLPSELASKSITVSAEPDAIVTVLRAGNPELPTLQNEEGIEATQVYLQTRIVEDEWIVALVNTDRQNETGALTLSLPANAGVCCDALCAEDGRILNVDQRLTQNGDHVHLKLSLPAAGSAIYRFAAKHAKGAEPIKDTIVYEEKPLIGSYSYSLEEENVCVLDYAEISIDGSEWSEPDEVLRLDQAVRKHYGFEDKNGEMTQPWFTKLSDSSVYGTVTVRYHITVDALPKGECWLAGERAFENSYAMNNIPLLPSGIDDFWVDDAFKRMPIPPNAWRKGENTITVTYPFCKNSNIEAVYLLGSFGVECTSKGSRITTLPSTLDISRDLSEQGLPFYGAGVTYHIPAQDLRALIVPDTSARLVFSENKTALIRVSCDGTEPIRIAWEPYIADLGLSLAKAETVDITAVLTRRNTFGPLHQYPPIVGAYAPGSFRSVGNDWRDEYQLIESRLPAILVQSIR